MSDWRIDASCGSKSLVPFGGWNFILDNFVLIFLREIALGVNYFTFDVTLPAHAPHSDMIDAQG
jgi:hypothetical protein